MRYLRAYEWSKPHTARSRGIVPFAFAHMFPEDNVHQASQLVPELASRAPGERALLPFWLLSKQIRRHIPELPGRQDIDPLTIFEEGLDPSPSIEWLRPLADGLRSRGVWLDIIIADVEDSVTTHGWFPPYQGDAWVREFERLYTSQRAWARFPPEVKRLRPRDYDPFTEEGRKAITVFNAYAHSILIKAIREVFIGSRLFHDDRGRQPFKISNWGCMRPSFPVKDFHQWEWLPIAVDSVSSPPMYLNEGGLYYRNRVHHPLWHCFVHHMNLARSVLGTMTGSLIPWISSARYYARLAEDGTTIREGYDDKNVWLWKEMMAHLVRAGCREFIFWNFGYDAAGTHRIMAETLMANDRPYTRRPLPELPMDVDEVTTRGYTTKYSDFLASIGGG